MPFLQDIPFHNRFWLQIGLPDAFCGNIKPAMFWPTAEYKDYCKVNDTFLSE